MQDRKLDGMRVAILLTDGFEQVEFTEPKKALEQAGARTTTISMKSGKVQGFSHDAKGDAFPVDMTLAQAKPDEFDAVLLPGGAFNADKLRVVREAQDFVRRAEESGKPIAAICHAPWLLVSAGLTHGRTLTSYHTLQDDIRNAGGQWLNLEVVHDRNWVTSRSPQDLPAFNEAMIDLFADAKAGQRRHEYAGVR